MFNKFLYKFSAFMSGRYGNDALNQTLLITTIILFVLNIFFKGSILYFIGLFLWIISILRMFSKNIYQRQQENQKYEKFIEPITKKITVMKKNKNDPANKYYRCPTCEQIVRVPKGRGKIEIRCPKCQSRFTKRT